MYSLTPDTWALANQDTLSLFRWSIDTLIVGFATWLSASKLYDLGYGSKKKQQKMAQIEEEKAQLEEQITKSQGSENGKNSDDFEVDTKLREILEERE